MGEMCGGSRQICRTNATAPSITTTIVRVLQMSWDTTNADAAQSVRDNEWKEGAAVSTSWHWRPYAEQSPTQSKDVSVKIKPTRTPWEMTVWRDVRGEDVGRTFVRKKNTALLSSGPVECRSSLSVMTKLNVRTNCVIQCSHLKFFFAAFWSGDW